MERVDPDYDAREEDLARMVHRVLAAYPIAYKSNNGGNGVFTRWVLGVVAALVVVGIPALVAVQYATVQRLAVLEVQIAFLLKSTK